MSFFQTVGDGRFGHVQPDFFHGLAEEIPIFRLVDGGLRSADQFHLVAFQHPFPHQIQSSIQGGLPPHGGQQGIGSFPFDDPS